MPTKTNNAPKPKTSRGSSEAQKASAVTPAKKMMRDDLDIEYFHNLLLEERARLEEEREQVRASSKDLEGSMPEDSEGGEEDTADLASAIMDKEMDLSVEEEIEDQLDAIDHALSKLADGTYGICDMSGEKIPEGRLKLIPWASLTVQCQAMSEGE